MPRIPEFVGSKHRKKNCQIFHRGGNERPGQLWNMLGDVYGHRKDAQMRSISNKLISFASPERFVEFRTRFPVLVQIICQPKTVI